MTPFDWALTVSVVGGTVALTYGAIKWTQAATTRWNQWGEMLGLEAPAYGLFRGSKEGFGLELMRVNRHLWVRVTGGDIRADLAFPKSHERGPAQLLFEQSLPQLHDEFPMLKSATIAFGVLQVTLPHQAAGSLAQLQEELGRILRLAQRLRLDEADIPVQLAKAATGSASVEHRTACWLHLTRGYPSHRETKETQAALLGEETPAPLRLLAAKAVPNGPVLKALLEDEESPDEVRTQAFIALLELKLFPSVTSLIQTALDSGVAPLQREALRHAWSTELERVCGLALKGAPGVQRDAVELLEKLQRPESESTLLLLLSSAHAELHVPVLSALKTLGTVRSVESVAALSREGAGEVKRLAHEVIRAIQNRIVGPGAGAISVASSDDLEGAVSLQDKLR